VSHVVSVCLSLIRPPIPGGRGGMLVSGWFLRKEFGMGLACVGFCMEKYGNVRKCIEMSGKG